MFVALTVAGVGFAAFSSSVYVNGLASSGNLALEIYGLIPTAGSPASPPCDSPGINGYFVGNTAYFNVTNMAPGASSCTLELLYENLGSLPGVLTYNLTIFNSVQYQGVFCLTPGEINCWIFHDSFGVGPSNSPSVWHVTKGSYPGSPAIEPYLVTTSPGYQQTDTLSLAFASGSTVPSNLSFTYTITGSWGI